MKRLALLFCLLAGPAFAGEIGIVIGTKSGALHRVIVPDSDAQLHKQNWAGDGETLIVRDQSVNITAEIEKYTGKPVEIALTALVDGNDVVTEVVVGDADLMPAIEGRRSIAAFPGVQAGQMFDRTKGVFIKPAHAEVANIEVGTEVIEETTLVPDTEVAPAPLELQPPLVLRPAQ